jgi:hypothetical protein
MAGHHIHGLYAGTAGGTLAALVAGQEVLLAQVFHLLAQLAQQRLPGQLYLHQAFDALLILSPKGALSIAGIDFKASIRNEHCQASEEGLELCVPPHILFMR